MPQIIPTQYHDLGSNVVATIDLQSGFNGMLIYGTAAGATSVVTSGTVANDMDFVIYWNGDAGNNACTVLGTAMPTAMITLNHFIVCHYNSVTTTWNVRFLPDAATAFIVNSMVSATAAIARSKLANGTASYVLVNSGAGVMSEEQFLNQVRGGFGADVSGFTGVVKVVAGVFSAASIVNADISAVAAIALSKLASGSAGQIIVCDGAGVPTYVTMTGDATIDQNGLVTLAAGQIQSFDVTIPTSNVLNLGTIPAQLVGAQGAGLGVELLSCTASMTYAGVAYATNGDLFITCQTASIQQASFSALGFLFGTVTRTVKAVMSGGGGATDTMIIANQPLIAQVDTGSPTAGTSDINIKGTYRVISVP